MSSPEVKLGLTSASPVMKTHRGASSASRQPDNGELIGRDNFMDAYGLFARDVSKLTILVSGPWLHSELSHVECEFRLRTMSMKQRGTG